MIETSARDGVRAALDAVVFVAGDATYTWQDVVLAAVREGEWAEIAEHAREGIACSRRAVDDGGCLDARETQHAAAAFRYARKLVSAEEMSAWLARWHLDVEDWTAWIERSILRARWASDLGAMEARYPVSPAEVAGATWTEAVCSGTLVAVASRLAARAAVALANEAGGHSRATDDDPEPPSATSSYRCGVAALAAEAAQQGLALLASDDCERRLARLARLEDAFRAFRSRTVTPHRVDEVIQAHRLEWMRVRIRTASFPSGPPAQEAVLCVREDREALGDVARATGAPLHETSALLEEIEPELRHRLLAATPGELLGPLPADAHSFTVIELIEKRAPAPDDVRIRHRAEDLVMRRAAEREIERHVVWRIAR
jgi:hypothetical protein